MIVINNNDRRAFTLIELLVVISIIGILSALLMSNFTIIRERARDTQRKSDLKQIQKALEMYKNNQTTVLQYPQTNDWTVMSDALTSGSYIKKVPSDPVDSPPLEYTYAYNISDTLKYTLKACLENASDKDGEADVNCTSGKKFELSEP